MKSTRLIKAMLFVFIHLIIASTLSSCCRNEKELNNKIKFLNHKIDSLRVEKTKSFDEHVKIIEALAPNSPDSLWNVYEYTRYRWVEIKAFIDSATYKRDSLQVELDYKGNCK